MTRKMLFTLLMGAILLGNSFGVANWPNFRGPELTGASPDATPPVKWSETENIKWKVQMTGDTSDGSPIVWGDKIIFQSAVKVGQETAPADTGAAAAPQPGGRRGQGGMGGMGGFGGMGGGKPTDEYKFNVVCLDRLTGKTLWETTVKQTVPHEGHHGDHGFASYSPVTDGKLIWADFGSRGTYCLDFDGKIKWGKELGQKQVRAGFGEGGSPALAGGNLIVMFDHEGDSFICGLDQQTGEIAWKKEREKGTSWTTPLALNVGGKEQVVVTGTKKSYSYDAKTGEVVWECSGGHTDNVIPTPVANDKMVFCVSGFRGAKLQAIKLGSTGDITGTDAIAWEINEAMPYVPSPILYDNHIYVCSSNDPIISCYNATTGAPFYVKQKLDEIKGVYASAVGAAGNVYFAGRNGVVYVIKNADTLEVVSINKLDDGFDSTPALVGNELYLKGKKYFYCIEKK